MEHHRVGELIDGKAIAAEIRKELQRDIAAHLGHVVPGLATVLVGERTDSSTYVRMKHKACEEVGIRSFHTALPEDVSEHKLLQVVRTLNDDPAVHGILVQLPLPPHIDEERVLAAVSLHKDVDGFHPVHLGRLAMKERQPLFVPCTPRACIELLRRSGVAIAGKHAVVLGRSNIVGLPTALLLLQHEHATVTVCHSRSADLAAHVRRADIVIAAIGKAEFVRREWLKPGAVVIDVGINRREDASARRGYRLVGDVHFDECREVAGKITPVPGGVGPMTICMLLRNCVESAKRQQQQQQQRQRQEEEATTAMNAADH